MLNSTIFDCLIYKGYGDRVAQRKHVPGESALVGPGWLELGLKDVTLAWMSRTRRRRQCRLPPSCTTASSAVWRKAVVRWIGRRLALRSRRRRASM